MDRRNKRETHATKEDFPAYFSRPWVVFGGRLWSHRQQKPDRYTLLSLLLLLEKFASGAKTSHHKGGAGLLALFLSLALLPPSPQTTPARVGKSAFRVALGRNFGATFRSARPCPRPAPVHHPKAADPELSAGGGDLKKVAPKILPRAARGAEFPYTCQATQRLATARIEGQRCHVVQEGILSTPGTSRIPEKNQKMFQSPPNLYFTAFFKIRPPHSYQHMLGIS